MKTFVFDLDGTLADISHRLHFIQRENKDWESFFRACALDKPIHNTVVLLNALSSGYRIIIATGRSDLVRLETEDWLKKHNIYYNVLMMRQDGDYQDDGCLKENWLSGGDLGPHQEIIGVFDDRTSVVNMWRRNGLLCYQVAQGDF